MSPPIFQSVILFQRLFKVLSLYKLVHAHDVYLFSLLLPSPVFMVVQSLNHPLPQFLEQLYFSKFEYNSELPGRVSSDVYISNQAFTQLHIQKSLRNNLNLNQCLLKCIKIASGTTDLKHKKLGTLCRYLLFQAGELGTKHCFLEN